MIIAVSDQKGGAGKSTVAVNLAACFDADDQGSTLDWKAVRPDSLPVVQAVGLPSDNLHKEIASLADRYEVVIIDGGGRITRTARAAVVAADFVVVPTLPSRLDIVSTELLREGDRRRPHLHGSAGRRPAQLGAGGAPS